MPKRSRIHYDIGASDFGENSISVAINGGDYTTIKDALDSLQSSGTATSSGVGYIVDVGAAWETDFFKGGSVTIDGTYAGTYIVTSNTATQINITGLANDPGLAAYTVWAASQSRGFVIRIMAGEYVEDNSVEPVRLLDFVSIEGLTIGFDRSTTVMPLDPSKTLFRSSINGTGNLRNLCISGITNSLAYGLLVDSGIGGFHTYSNIFFEGCSNGTLVTGAGIWMVGINLNFDSCDVCVSVRDQGEVELFEGVVMGGGTTVISCEDSGSKGVVHHYHMGESYTNGIYVDKGAQVLFNALHVEDIVNCLRVGSNGGTIRGNSALLEGDGVVYNILDDTAFPYSAEIRMNGVGDKSKISSTNPDSQINFFIFSEEVGNKGFAIGGRFISPWANTVTVSESGGASGDYTTISEAVAAILDASVAKPYTIFVYPGVYLENNPIIMKPYVSLIAVGGVMSTKIQAQNINSNILEMSVYSKVSGFELDGATGGAALYYSGGGYASVNIDNLAVNNCDSGIVVSGTGSILYAVGCAVHGTVNNAVRVLNNAQCHMRDTNIVINSGTGSAIEVDNATLDAFIVYVYTVSGLTNGIYVNNGGNAHVSSVHIEGTTNAIRLGNTGVNQSEFVGVMVHNSIEYDVLSDSSSNVISINGGHISVDKVKSNNCTYNAFYFHDKQWQSAQLVEGRLVVGSIQNPANFVTGSGPFYITNMTVMTNTNGEVGTWNDITASVTNNDDVGIDLFAGTGADNCLYIGVTNTFCGIRYLVKTAINLGTGSIVWEYWNGSAWTMLHNMATKREPQYDAYDNSFASVTWIQDRFDHGILYDFAIKTLNSVADVYWVRCRIVDPITTIPQVDVVDIQPNSTAIRWDGSRHYFGSNRYLKNANIKTYSRPNKASQFATSQVTNIANAISIKEENLTFVNGEVNDVVFYVDEFPFGADLSCPILFEVHWYSDVTTGSVNWHVEYAVDRLGVSVLDGSIVKETAEAICIVNPVAYIAIKSTISIYLMPTQITPGDAFYIRLYRDARSTNTDDTLVGNVVVTRFELGYRLWSDTNLNYIT